MTVQFSLDKKLTDNKFTAFLFNRQIFSIIYIVVCTLWFFPILGMYMDIISKLCFCWGAVLIGYDIITKRQLLNSYGSWILVLMIASYALTVILNYQDMLYMGIKHLIYNGILVLILYSSDFNKTKETYISYLKILNNILISIVFVASLASFILYLFSVQFVIHFEDMDIRQGFLENRLFGIYTSPNTGALLSIISFVLMLMNFFLYNKKLGKLKVLYVANTIMQIIYYSLTLSRGGFLTFAVLAVLFAVLFLLPKFMKKHSITSSCILCAITSVVLIGMIVCVPYLLRYALSYTPYYVQKVTVGLGMTEPTPDEQNDKSEKIEFVRIESGDDTSNGRLDIWLAGLTAWKNAPLFGIADINIVNDDKTVSGKVGIENFSEQNIKDLIKANGNMHNSYVQILVCAGAVGFVLFATFAVLILRKYFLMIFKMKTDSQDYKIVSSILCLVGLLAANGLVENHLLFDRQDPYGAIFWFYLGVGLFFIKNYFRQQMNEQNKFAFICDTPIQILNALNFVSNDIRGSNGKSDIYVYHQFANSHEICEKLKSTDFFENVYDVTKIKSRNKLLSLLSTFLRLVFPDAFLKKNVSNWKKNSDSYYKYLVVCAYAPFQVLMRKKYSDAELLAMEEGLASYFGNNMQDGNSKLMQIADKIIFNGNLQAKATELYVNNTDLCNSTISEKIIKLPSISDNKFICDWKNVFCYTNNSAYKERKFIILTQPFCEFFDTAADYDRKLRDIIINEKISDNFIVRKHPRQKENLYSGIENDNLCNSWELESIIQISNNNILMSIFSTSEVMPYILSDKQPYLIFTYKIALKGFDKDKLENMDKFIFELSKRYDLSKIFVPTTFDELVSDLKLLNN